ncbi:hypothetical protein HF086_001590 [Spodoptera exigua]|uniref:Peptidase S54 rhomboid domain-containing protein n=1 Tax=Spodoptera exigua TaxID=7107 RepID=A0A922MNX4_SPOEX|nr:hypothetical protein HF086_001590 [Spodoptera exigua]
MWHRMCKKTDGCSYKVLSDHKYGLSVCKYSWNRTLKYVRYVIDYFDGTYEEEYSCWPPAICMILISLVEIVLFCYDAAQGHTQGDGTIAKLFIYNPHKRQEAWRFITYMLVHVGSCYTLQRGPSASQSSGAVVPRSPSRDGASVVASGVGVPRWCGRRIPSHQSDRPQGLFSWSFRRRNWSEMEFAIIQLLVFVLLAAVDIGTAVYDRYWRHLDQNIGYVAHLAGAIAGLLVGIGVLRNLEKRKWEKRLWWAAVLIYCSLMAAGILANIFWTDRFQKSL